jgi:hypothetical protein
VPESIVLRGRKTKSDRVCGSVRKKRKEFIMRTLILGLVIVLLAAPVWAKVTIEVVPRTGELVADINYALDGAETELARAFALDITVSDGNIVSVADFAVGDDNGGYGIFPANFSRHINVNANGEVDDWSSPDYTPVADGADPGAQPGLNTGGITIELGSLYETNAPGTSGTLCSITISECADVTLALNGMRGGVVMESAAAAGDVELIGANVCPITLCFPDTFTTFADWQALGEPLCWCNSANGGTGDYQCDGDADGAEFGFQKYRVYSPDLALLVDNWKKKIDDVTLNPCADVDHKPFGFQKYRVYSPDLAILVDNWKKKAGDLPGNCGLLSRPE